MREIGLNEYLERLSNHSIALTEDETNSLYDIVAALNKITGNRPVRDLITIDLKECTGSIIAVLVASKLIERKNK